MATKRSASAPEGDWPSKSLRSGGPQLSEKLVIFCNSWREDKNGLEVYMVDLGLEFYSTRSDYMKLLPMIRHEGFEIWAGCALNSTVYIFEGFSSPGGSRFSSRWGSRKFDFEVTPSQRARKFDLDSLLAGDLDPVLQIYRKGDPVGLEGFSDVAPMKHPKYKPAAVPTPDGKKILVFQLSIRPGDAETCFELYDPWENTWTVLQPPDYLPRHEVFIIDWYTFIDEYRFMIGGDEGCVHIVSVDPNKKVGPMLQPETQKLAYGMERQYGVTIDGRVRICPELVSHLDECYSREFKLTPFETPYPFYACEDDPPGRFVARLDHTHGQKEKEAYTLISTAQQFRAFPPEPEPEKSTRLLMDVCHTNLASLETTVIGTHRFIIDGDFIMRLQMFVF